MVDAAERLQKHKVVLEREQRIRRLYELPIFFVGGLPRSGTTWVQNILSAHPEIGCFGEARFFNRLVPGLADALADYGKIAGDQNPNAPLPIELINGPTMAAVLRYAVYAHFERNIQKPLNELKLIGEKTPDNVVRVEQLNRLFPEAKLVHIIRDGRDGLVSGWHRFRHVLKVDFEGYVDLFAGEWCDRLFAIRAFMDRNPGVVHELTYEGLHGDPAGTVTRMLAWLGVTAEPGVVAKCLEAARFDVVSGGRAQGQEDTGSHYRKGVTGGFRKELTPAQIERFNARAAPALEMLGYDID